jgi:hypothetical protein
MGYSSLLPLLVMLALACSPNKSADNPRPSPSLQDSLDSAVNRVAGDTMADTSGHRDTTTSRE